MAKGSIPSTMRAAVMRKPGGPEVLKVEEVPVPTPKANEVLIKIKAAGLNRSELFTRRGDSGPSVPLPRVLGIECVGVIASVGGDASSAFTEGDVVTTAMGGLGRTFDGGYAEYTAVPAKQVVKLSAHTPELIGWDVLGAIPEMVQTAYGSLQTSLQLKEGETLLVRGGTTSVGMAAASIAKHWMGAKQVIGTTRRSNPKTEEAMKNSGVDDIVIDDGHIADKIQTLIPGGVNKTLELIGVTTLKDSLLSTRKGGIVCNTGIVGNNWTLPPINPMEFIPTAVGLTAYNGGNEDVLATPFDEVIRLVSEGKLKVQIGKRFSLDQIEEAHKLMEENKAGGKIVLVME